MYPVRISAGQVALNARTLWTNAQAARVTGWPVCPCTGHGLALAASPVTESAGADCGHEPPLDAAAFIAELNVGDAVA